MLQKPTRNALPKRLFAGIRYRLYGWTSPAVQHLSDEAATRAAPTDLPFKELSFTYAVIALSARVACEGGGLTRGKYAAFRAAFPLSGGICGKLRSLFILACENPVPTEHYATQVKFAFPGQSALFMSLLDRLFSIASADGDVSPATERTLAKIAHVLGITAGDYTRLRDHYCLKADPRRILGVGRKTSARALKKRYHDLMRRYHPDRFTAETITPEIAMVLKLRTSEINHAYNALSRRAA